MAKTATRKEISVKGKPLEQIVHDLKTPLSTIMGFSEMLLRSYDQKQELKRHWIEHIFSESKRLQSMIDAELRQEI